MTSSSITPLEIPDVRLIEPQVWADARGLFFESYRQQAFDAVIGRPVVFVQDNHSISHRHVLRGLHYQLRRPQGKLVRVVRGCVWDVAVDLRAGSPTLGRWVACTLSAENRRQLWIPEGFAHGFVVLSAQAEVLYKVTADYDPDDERCIFWRDPDLAIAWPEGLQPRLSDRDAAGQSFRDAETCPLAHLRG